MKKKLCALLLAGLLLLTASGCGSVFEDEYYYEEPVTGGFGALEGNATEIRNFSMLKTAITDMISRHEEQREFRMSNYHGSPSEDLAAACFEIKSNHPLGAYAVESISYDTSYVVSYYIADIVISYKRSAEEMNSIVYALTQNEFDESVLQAVESFQQQSVVRLYSSSVDEDYICRLVRQRYYDDPVSMVMEPQADVTVYPQEGANRIYDIRLTYGTTQAMNMALSLSLTNRLAAAMSELTETEPLYQALECALYLDGLQEAAEGDYADTAYGALVDHAADPKGLTLAYRAMCKSLNIPCLVVEGRCRALGMEPHFWNIITLDGENYHVDISRLAEAPARSFLCSDNAFWGEYIWDMDEYPACEGSLAYSDAARLDLEPEEADVPEMQGTQERPEETEPGDPSASEQTDLPEPPEQLPESEQTPGETDAEEIEKTP